MEAFTYSYFFIPSTVFFKVLYSPLPSINLLSVQLFLKLHMHIAQDLWSTIFPCLLIITHKNYCPFFNLVLNTLFFVDFFSCYLFVHTLFIFEKQAYICK